MFTTNRTRKTLAALAACATIAFAGLVLADHKPNHNRGGGGGGDDPPAGTIYFWLGFTGELAQMDADGGTKTTLPTGVGGEPSRDLHGERRWFLQLREIVDESYPSGQPRRELFALRGDGNEAFTVQLTDQPDLEPLPEAGAHLFWGFVRWGAGDAEISWIARRWDVASRTVLEGGIYAAGISFDGDGNVLGLDAPPDLPLVDAALVDQNGIARPEIRSHDWSPDGTEIVYAFSSAVDIRRLGIADVVAGTGLEIPTEREAAWPVWSPDGSKIAFQRGAGRSSIPTIRPDGGGEKVIVRRTPRTGAGTPFWSPDGAHVIYIFGGSVIGDDRFDLYRVTSRGGGKANLTADLDTRYLSGNPAWPVAWR